MISISEPSLLNRIDEYIFNETMSGPLLNNCLTSLKTEWIKLAIYIVDVQVLQMLHHHFYSIICIVYIENILICFNQRYFGVLSNLPTCNIIQIINGCLFYWITSIFKGCIK